MIHHDDNRNEEVQKKIRPGTRDRSGQVHVDCELRSRNDQRLGGFGGIVRSGRFGALVLMLVLVLVLVLGSTMLLKLPLP